MSTKQLQIIGGELLQSDWNEQNKTSIKYIANRPNISSDFTGSWDDITNKPDFSRMQNKGLMQKVVLDASNWSESEPYIQTMNVAGVTLSSKIDLQADADTINTIINNGYCLSVENNNGVAIIHAIGTKPTVNLTLQLVVTEIIKENEADVVWGDSLLGAGVATSQPYGGFVVSPTQPEDTNMLWIDPNGGLKYFNGTEWVVVPVAYS